MCFSVNRGSYCNSFCHQIIHIENLLNRLLYLFCCLSLFASDSNCQILWHKF